MGQCEKKLVNYHFARPVLEEVVFMTIIEDDNENLCAQFTLEEVDQKTPYGVIYEYGIKVLDLRTSISYYLSFIGIF